MISNRKLEHLLICNNYDVEFKDKHTGFNDIELIHKAIPQINKEDIDISCNAFGKEMDSPLFITAITGGHPESKKINKELAIACDKTNIALGVGSQRAAIEHSNLKDTYSVVRKFAPDCLLLGNIGAPQINYASNAVDILDADILAVHLNPLQEVIQPGGDLDARNYLESISEIVDLVDIPVMVKETGCGISAEIALELEKIGVNYIDVEGAGGTSWAGVETYRSDDKYFGELFWDWGIPTAVSTVECVDSVNIPVVSSGGIRSGLDAAKAIALGASAVGMALPFLKYSYLGHEKVIEFIEKFNESLKIAMFLVGASNLEELKSSPLIIKGETKEWLSQRGINTINYSRR